MRKKEKKNKQARHSQMSTKKKRKTNRNLTDGVHKKDKRKNNHTNRPLTDDVHKEEKKKNRASTT